MTTTIGPSPMPASRISGPVARTIGHTAAPTIHRRIPVTWELDASTGSVTANSEYAGRVHESLPGKLYYFQSLQDAARNDLWGMFRTADEAAEAGAVRATLYRHEQP